MGGDNATAIAALCAGAGGALRALGEAFVGPATAGVALDYLASAISAGLLSSVAGVSVHPYRAAPLPRGRARGQLGDLAALRTLLDARGCPSSGATRPRPPARTATAATAPR